MRLILSIFGALVIVGCGGGSVTTSRGVAETTLTRAPLPTPTSSPSPKQSPPVAPEVLAEQYVRALFTDDWATLNRLYPDSQPDPGQDERRLQLIRLQTAPLTREQTNDNNPLSSWQYTRVVADVRYQDRIGQFTYTIGFRPDRELVGHLEIAMVIRIGSWQ